MINRTGYEIFICFHKMSENDILMGEIKPNVRLNYLHILINLLNDIIILQLSKTIYLLIYRFLPRTKLLTNIKAVVIKYYNICIVTNTY